MVGADLLRAGLATALIFVHDSTAAVYIAFGMSVGAVLFNPAANSTLPALVTDRELVAANSGIWTAAVLSQIALAPKEVCCTPPSARVPPSQSTG